MKPINLRNIVVSNKGLNTETRNALYRVWEISPKQDDLAALESLINEFDKHYSDQYILTTKLLSECYFNFSIPRISKEFDCLWIGDKTIVNIELKSQNVGEDKIKKQLVQNKYYLRYLKKTLSLYTYDSSTGRFYWLDNDGNLIDVKFEVVVSALNNIHDEKQFGDDIEILFPPENYLVSPFNSTKEFMNGNYFLTDQQQKTKKQIIQVLNDDSKGCFCGLWGGPGSGKSLLLYDIAKTLMESGKNVLMGHAGALNAGHNMLISNGWNIKITKDFCPSDFMTGTPDLVDADIYMVDEAQRCNNYESIINRIANKKRKCLLSFDGEQIMSNREQIRNNDYKIKKLVGDNLFKLTSNIRTNDAVYEFVRALFDLHHSVNKSVHGNIEITFCQNTFELKNMLELLRFKGYKVPKFTPIIHGVEEYESWFPIEEQSAHRIIGQEFDIVVGYVSDKLFYNQEGKLVSQNKYLYREDKMLYQILTRARRKIHLVILNNTIVLDRCLKLMSLDV